MSGCCVARPRRLARGLIGSALGLAFGLVTAFATPPDRPTAAPVRAAPTRPSPVWAFTKVDGIEWVKLDDLAKHFGFKSAWVRPGVEQTLADSRGVRLRFEANQRDFYLDDVRVFLGRQVLQHKGLLWIARLDVLKTVAPLVRPAENLAHLPAAPPKVIVLDAGHGGNDPGKQNLKLKLDEKDMTLDVVLRLRKLLELRGYTVRLTREKDERLANEQRADLDRRAAVTKDAKADLFLSIHFNAVEPKDAARVSGTETYVLTPQFQWSSTDNSGDSLTGTAFPGNRQDVANVVAGYQLHRAMLAGLKTSDRGFKRGRLRVLLLPECPAALLEAAYLSNDAEAARVGTAEFRQQIAEAIAEGVQNYAGLLAALRPATSSAQ